ncbi:hypothetical protein [Rugamonas aquatica]|nr:hypothetical protein [Rugamonas aquatica]
MSNWFRCVLFIFVIFCEKYALAQCVNSATPSCGVYTQCFAKYCNCSTSSSEYFISYGKNYCERFLGNTKFSKEGEKWRNATLVCLQEAIVPHLEITEPVKACDCPAMRKVAIDSHVGCYTQPSNSICNLPTEDLVEIGKIVALKDIFSKEGWDTMKQIAAKCKTTAGSADKRDRWDTMSKALNAY